MAISDDWWLSWLLRRRWENPGACWFVWELGILQLPWFTSRSRLCSDWVHAGFLRPRNVIPVSGRRIYSNNGPRWWQDANHKSPTKASTMWLTPKVIKPPSHTSPSRLNSYCPLYNIRHLSKLYLSTNYLDSNGTQSTLAAVLNHYRKDAQGKTLSQTSYRFGEATSGCTYTGYTSGYRIGGLQYSLIDGNDQDYRQVYLF